MDKKEEWVVVPVELKELLARMVELHDSRGTVLTVHMQDVKEMLAVEPDVQGEPVGLRQRFFNGWKGCSNHGCVVVDPKPGMMHTNGSCQCVVNASRSQLYMLQGRIQSVLSATQQPAEHQPDATQLLKALERIANMDSMSYHSLDSAKITARAALAAHQKREE